MRHVLRILIVLLVLAPAAAAEPVVARASIAREDRAAIDAAIAQARRRAPAAFASVERVLAGAGARDEGRRGGRFAVISPELEARGPAGAGALADHLLRGSDAAAGAQLTAAVGAITAAGALGDPRLRPLWIAVLDGDESRPDVLRAAAEALARTCDAPDARILRAADARSLRAADDAAARALVVRAAGDGPAAQAVQSAMGACRQRVVATALAARLDAALTALRRGQGAEGAHEGAVAEAGRLIGALAELGADWAWQTPALRDRADRDELRAIAAAALKRATRHVDDGVRAAAARGLRVIAVRAR